MKKTEILKLAQQVVSNTQLEDIALLEGGYNSRAYKVTPDANEAFVLLVESPEANAPSDFDHMYTVLTLLHQSGFAHAPKPLWLSDDHMAIAMSYFEGVTPDKFDFKSAGVDKQQLALQVMDTLVDVGSIDADQYMAVAKNFGVTAAPIQYLTEAVKKYGIAWFEIVERACPDTDIVDWLRLRVQRSINLAATISVDRPIFGHGDPSNPNLLIGPDGNFMIIDWGSARFDVVGPRFTVAYTTHLNELMKPFYDVIVSHVAKRLGMDTAGFASQVYEYRQYSEVLDVNWAAMMMARVNAGEIQGDIDHFRTICRERMRLYDEAFPETKS